MIKAKFIPTLKGCVFFCESDKIKKIEKNLNLSNNHRKELEKG